MILLPSKTTPARTCVEKETASLSLVHGGKFSHLDWLLPFAACRGVHHYCEPFGGSAAVLLNVRRRQLKPTTP